MNDIHALNTTTTHDKLRQEPLPLEWAGVFTLHMQ